MPLMPPDGRPDALQAARATIAEQFLARQSLEDELRAATARADRLQAELERQGVAHEQSAVILMQQAWKREVADAEAAEREMSEKAAQAEAAAVEAAAAALHERRMREAAEARETLQATRRQGAERALVRVEAERDELLAAASSASTCDVPLAASNRFG